MSEGAGIFVDFDEVDEMPRVRAQRPRFSGDVIVPISLSGDTRSPSSTVSVARRLGGFTARTSASSLHCRLPSKVMNRSRCFALSSGRVDEMEITFSTPAAASTRANSRVMRARRSSSSSSSGPRCR